MNSDFKVEPQYSKTFFLAAGQCNAEGFLPLQWLVQRLIDVATLHANSINIGYDRLKAFGASWVLHSVAVSMYSYPRVNESFTVETWIVKTSVASSDRAFRILDQNNKVIGYALTTWAAIDFEKRRAVRLANILTEGLPDNGIYPPMDRYKRTERIGNPTEIFNYRFLYTDLDCNRHVTSRRHVELMLNCLPLDFFDKYMVSRLELAFHTEALFGQDADISFCRDDEKSARMEITVGSALLSAARICVKEL